MMLSLAMAEANKSQEMMLKLKKKHSHPANQHLPSKSLKALELPKSIKLAESPKVAHNVKASLHKPKKCAATASVASSCSTTSSTKSAIPIKIKSAVRDLRVASVNLSSNEKKISINEALSTAIKSNPDIIILNEYQYYDQSEANTKFVDKLKAQSFTLHYAQTYSTTAVASRMPIANLEEVCISDDRNAVLLQVQVPKKDNASVWLYSTASCRYGTHERQYEVKAITEHIATNLDPTAKVLLFSDLDNEAADDTIVCSHRQCVEDDHVIRTQMTADGYDVLSELADTWTTTSLDGTSMHSHESNGKLTAAKYTFSRNVYGGSYFESSRDGLCVSNWYL